MLPQSLLYSVVAYSGKLNIVKVPSAAIVYRLRFTLLRTISIQITVFTLNGEKCTFPMSCGRQHKTRFRTSDRQTSSVDSDFFRLMKTWDTFGTNGWPRFFWPCCLQSFVLISLVFISVTFFTNSCIFLEDD